MRSKEDERFERLKKDGLEKLKLTLSELESVAEGLEDENIRVAFWHFLSMHCGQKAIGMMGASNYLKMSLLDLAEEMKK